VVGATVANHIGVEVSVGREHAVVAVPVGAGRGDEAGEPLERLEGREPQAGAAVGEGAGGAVDEVCVGPAQGGLSGGGVEPVQREGRPGTVPDEALEVGAVVGLDTDGSVEAEATGAAPGAHVGGLVEVEEAPADEESEQAVLDEGGEGAGGVGVESPSAVEGEGAPTVGCEESVEDDDVQVEVRFMDQRRRVERVLAVPHVTLTVRKLSQLLIDERGRLIEGFTAAIAEVVIEKPGHGLPAGGGIRSGSSERRLTMFLTFPCSHTTGVHVTGGECGGCVVGARPS
jgi:hypothetical protein